MKRLISIVLTLVLLLSSTVTYISAYTLPEGFEVSKEPNVGKDTIKGNVYGYLGDVDMSDDINVKDATNIQKYSASLVNLSDTEETLADVDFSGDVNVKDATVIQKWIASITVDLPVGHVLYIPDNSDENHTHSIVEVKKVAATCTEKGNIAYWKCLSCDMCFSEEDGSIVILKESTDIKPLGHVEVVDPAVLATHNSTGLTEGSHCSRCGTVIKKQEVVPALKSNEFSIKYYITNNDSYLQSVGVENANPDYYDSEVGLRLSNISVDGYVFEGWYDGQGASAERIKIIEKGETGNIELYAHWTKVKYTVTFDSPLVPIDNVTRTIDQTTTLENLEWDGYIFMGWSDNDGKIRSSVEPGTADITLHANWTSQRNQTRPNDYKNQKPIVIDDSDNGMYYFVYDIGTIINVPLYTIEDFANKMGISITESYTKSDTISSSNAKEINQTIENATTKSSSWTLSKDWNELITETEGNVTSQTKEDSVSISDGSSTAHTDSGNRNIGASKEIASKEGTTSKTISKESMGMDAEVSGGVETKFLKTSVKMGMSASYEDTDEEGSSTEESKSRAATWNSDKGFSDSATTSHNKTVNSSIAESISDTWEYSVSKSVGGSDSTTESSSVSQADTKGYASSFTYSTETTETRVSTWTNEGAPAGYYRLVCAGQVHVFGIVGYNIATRDYFAYTYGLLDDETYDYYDYSKNDPFYGDYENGVLPFEVPVYVNQYVSDSLYYSDGLIIDRETGVITDYEGIAKNVWIPDYVTLSNGDGTSSAIKVTGIDSYAFVGNNNITSIKLGKYITEIPDGAFENCSKLKVVSYNKLTSIGSRAFAGCTSLKSFTVDETITFLGSGAFDGVNEIIVNASNVSVVDMAITSSVKSLTLNVGNLKDKLEGKKLLIGASDTFVINGKNRVFSNLAIESNAKTTSINMMVFANNSEVPLNIDSERLVLNQVTIQDAPGLALMITSDKANIELQGKNVLSTKGQSAILCKDISLIRVNGVTESTSLSVQNGDVLVCGTIENQKYLSVTDGVIKYITSDEFKNILNSHRVVFDANGGYVDVEYKTVMWNSAVGELPIPTRTDCTFDGWYTEDGVKVTADTVFTQLTDLTVKARWYSSGWVSISKLPADAQRIDTKWSYNLTTNITSDKSYVAGYTLYNTTSAWGSYGPWSAWSKSAVSNSDSRQVETKTVTDKAGYTNYNYWIYRTSDGWGYGTKNYVVGSHGACTVYDEINLNYSLPVYNSSLETYGPYNSSKFSHSGDSYWFYGGSTWVPAVTHTEYRYRDRSLVYTYHHTKTESLESSTVPSGTGVSNVTEWVKYMCYE